MSQPTHYSPPPTKSKNWHGTLKTMGHMVTNYRGFKAELRLVAKITRVYIYWHLIILIKYKFHNEYLINQIPQCVRMRSFRASPRDKHVCYLSLILHHISAICMRSSVNISWIERLKALLWALALNHTVALPQATYVASSCVPKFPDCVCLVGLVGG